MEKQPYRLWIAALLLGWAFDYLFWKQYIGLNFPVFLTLCLIVGIALIWSYRIKPAPRSLWLLVPFALFATISVIRAEPLTVWLAVTFTLVSAGLLAASFVGGRWVEFSLWDYALQTMGLGVSMFTQPVLFQQQVIKTRKESGETAKTLPIGPVVRGFAIAIPILVVFSFLLASADAVYNQKVIDFFDIDDLPENILRLGIILLVAYAAAGVFLYAAQESRNEKLIGEDKPLVPPFLGFIEASIVLGSLAALFLLFVVIQFQYFFGGEVNIGIEGYTYSAYARRGFNELATVAFLSLLVILSFSAITKRGEGTQQRIFSGLCVAVAALVVVMLVSALQRLALAIDWHGFSRLRLYPRVFIIWIGILLVATVALEFTRRERYFALAALLASMGFAATLAFVNVDAAIVRHNIQRELQERHLNINHLSSLSTDAVPPLVDAYNDKFLPLSSRQGAAAALLCFYHNDKNWIEIDEDWRSQNFSQRQAFRLIQSLLPKLDDYQVNDDVTVIRVETPNGVYYDCALGVMGDKGTAPNPVAEAVAPTGQ